jgi:hypothetical protein
MPPIRPRALFKEEERSFVFITNPNEVRDDSHPGSSSHGDRPHGHSSNRRIVTLAIDTGTPPSTHEAHH